MKTTEIKIGGFGGQGVIMMGYIIGRAAAIYGGGHATMTQSFGPEARGSACSSQVIISGKRILYPYVATPEVLVVMSQEAFDKFSPGMSGTGLLLHEQDLVNPGKLKKGMRAFSVPATRIAEELGRKIVLNIVMIGFFTAVAGLIDAEAMRKAVETSVPAGTEKMNLEAFDRGYEYGLKLFEESKTAEVAK